MTTAETVGRPRGGGEAGAPHPTTPSPPTKSRIARWRVVCLSSIRKKKQEKARTARIVKARKARRTRGQDRARWRRAATASTASKVYAQSAY